MTLVYMKAYINIYIGLPKQSKTENKTKSIAIIICCLSEYVDYPKLLRIEHEIIYVLSCLLKHSNILPM